MNKKVVIGVIVIVLIILGYFLFKPKPGFSDEPEDWIEKGPAGSVEINVIEAMKGRGFIDEIGQQFRERNMETVFDWEGFYKGTYFLNEYIDESGTVRMRISPDMKANDGIIEGFVMERKEGDQLVIYVFVDEDWKQAMPQTNLFWGVDLENEKTFAFTDVGKGIYMDSVIDDPNRFSEDMRIHQGGLVVGDITREQPEGATLINFI